MRKLTAVGLAIVALGAGAVAHADIASIYGQGHGGLSGNDTAPGPTLGVEVGGSILAFQGYFNIDDYVTHGTVKRLIFGVGSGIGLAGWRLSGRAGAGLMFENNGVFGMMAPVGDRSGFCARAGASFDRQVAAMLYLGVGLDGEYFAIKPTDDSVLDTSVHTGGDIIGSLHLRFEVGI
jgi:hypothetical protein